LCVVLKGVLMLQYVTERLHCCNQFNGHPNRGLNFQRKEIIMQRKIISLIITAAISCFSAFTSNSLNNASQPAASAANSTSTYTSTSAGESCKDGNTGATSKSDSTVTKGNCNTANNGCSAEKAQAIVPSKQTETSGNIASTKGSVTKQNNPAASSSKASSKSSCYQPSSQNCDPQTSCKSPCLQNPFQAFCAQNPFQASCQQNSSKSSYSQPSQKSGSQSSSKPSSSKSSSGSTVSQTPSKPASSIASTSSYSEFQNEVVRLVNVERAKNSLPALTADSLLMKTATVKSQDMANNNYFDHTSPTYGSPFDLMKKFGVTYRAAGENIAMGQTTPAQVMNGWMNSSGHRANILNSAYTKIGVGIAKNASGRYYWTQHFTG
jgi:uncharacterized YkwD family protein